MRNYLLDTNILLYYIRQDHLWDKVQNRFDLKTGINAISIINIGELWSIALRNQWGERRLKQLENISNEFTVIDLNIESIVKRYGEIDAYSQGKLKERPLSTSARNMGKNDLWLAATASVLNLTLITSDQDFNHLAPTFLSLEALDMQQI